MFDFIKILLENLMNQRFEDYIKDYDSHILEELGFKECGTIRINAFRFVYSVIH